MFFDDEPSEVIGAYCTLQEDYNGYSDGQVVGDLGIELIIRLTNGKEIVAYRDEVYILD
ncbi:MAG: ribonuclease P [Paramuribaculum sp.]|nr:ribonuclease P [Paramuribaculum sp.]